MRNLLQAHRQGRPPPRLQNQERETVKVSKSDHFREWLRQVDIELTRRCGLSHDDLADQPWRDWFDDEMSAAEAAEECLVIEGFP
jgi:hypothetical protein